MRVDPSYIQLGTCMVCMFIRDTAPPNWPTPEVNDAILEAVSLIFEAEIPLCYDHLMYADGFISPTDNKCYWTDGMVT